MSTTAGAIPPAPPTSSIDEFDEWRLLNQDMLLRLRENKPELFRLFEKNIEGVHERLLGTPS